MGTGYNTLPTYLTRPVLSLAARKKEVTWYGMHISSTDVQCVTELLGAIDVKSIRALANEFSRWS